MEHEAPDDPGKAENARILDFLLLDELWKDDMGQSWHRARLPGAERAAWLQTVQPGITSIAWSRNDGNRKALERLAISCQSLRHSGILCLRELHHDAEWRRTVLEYADPGAGFQPLSAWLREKEDPIPFEQALSLWEKVAAAVVSVHRSEPAIVHGDLRPANVFVTADGDQIRVGGFQISRFLHQSVLGKPGSPLKDASDYLGWKSPEQLENPGTPSPPASDVFALGLLFFRLLTGSLPTARTEADPATIRARWKSLTAAGRSPRRFLEKTGASQGASGIPAYWDRQIVRMCHPSPARRPRLADLLDQHRSPANGIGKTVAVIAGLAVIAGVGAWTVLKASREEGFPSPPPSSPAPVLDPFVNSLGQTFVPVPGTDVLFATTETRVRDYAVFAAEKPGIDPAWKNVGFEQTPEHPVVQVTWEEATAFCDWLTDHERKSGSIPSTALYRLPSDHEWSCAIGLGDRESPAATPERKHDGFPDLFPWGGEFPPPARVGNYCGVESDRTRHIEGYRDDYPQTAPVGSFGANRLGLSDLGGNVWEFCRDWFSKEERYRVLRGGAWNDFEQQDLASSAREYYSQNRRNHSHGFRCVLELKNGGQ